MCALCVCFTQRADAPGLKETFNVDMCIQCMCVCVLTRKDEFAAVTVPCGLMNAGFSLAICSMVEGRMPLSLETISRPGKDKNILCRF